MRIVSCYVWFHGHCSRHLFAFAAHLFFVLSWVGRAFSKSVCWHQGLFVCSCRVCRALRANWAQWGSAASLHFIVVFMRIFHALGGSDASASIVLSSGGILFHSSFSKPRSIMTPCRAFLKVARSSLSVTQSLTMWWYVSVGRFVCRISRPWVDAAPGLQRRQGGPTYGVVWLSCCRSGIFLFWLRAHRSGSVATWRVLRR